MKVCTTNLVLVLALLLPFVARTASAGEVVDRIVATVNGRVILQSDLNEALCYEAVLSGRQVSQFTDDERRAVLDHLIDQELLREQKLTDFQHATEAEVAARLADARKQYPQAATDEGWHAVLAKFHLSIKDIEVHVAKEIDLLRRVDARLRPNVQIDSKNIEAYYREKFVPQLQRSGAGEVPLAEVTAKIRELLTEQKVNELLVSWLQTLRSESEVRIPEVSAPASEGAQSR